MIDSLVVARQALKIINQKTINSKSKTIIPDEETLSRVIEILFWCSLVKNEGSRLNTRIFFVPKEDLNNYGIIRLNSPQPITYEAISQLSPAQNPEGGLIVTIGNTSEVYVEGILGGFSSTKSTLPLWLCVESRGNGVVRISYSLRPILEFVRGRIRQLGGMTFDRNSAALLLIKAGLFLGDSISAFNLGVSHALLDIGFAIEETNNGGAIWILPTGIGLISELAGLGKIVNMPSSWWEPYYEAWEIQAPRNHIVGRDLGGDDFIFRALKEWDYSRRRTLSKTIAGLAGFDGAIVMNGTPEVLAFGVVCNQFKVPAVKVLLADDTSGSLTGKNVDKASFGGSRHQSAIDFCSSFHPAGALVAAQDGGLSVFTSLGKGSVIGNQISMIPSELFI